MPSLGRAAERWYVRQVAGFVWRATWFWALVFSGAFLARTLYDWLVPTTQFALRSAISTWAGISTLLVASAWGAWRSRSFGAGLLTAVVTSQVAALMSVAGAALLLAIWHDPRTQEAIAGSGGLDEVCRAAVHDDHPGGDLSGPSARCLARRWRSSRGRTAGPA